MTPHASNPVEHPKWRSLVVEQGMLGVANDELGGLPEAAETEAIVATAEFQILCLLEERQRRQNLVKGIRGHADTSQKFKNRAETASTAEANAQDNILLARKLFAIVYAHTEAVEVPRTDREFELAFGLFVRTYGGKTPESLEKRHAEKGRLKSILAATLIGREEDHSVDTPLHVSAERTQNLNVEHSSSPGTDTDVEYRKFKDTTRKMSLARLLKEGRARKGREYYHDITPEMLEDVAPERLWASLVGPDVLLTNGTTVAMTYKMPQSGRKLAVAISPEENKVLIQAPGHYGAKASDGVRLHRPAPFSDADYDAMVRAAQHALDPRLQAMITYKERTLERQEVLLGKFVESAEFPGLQRFGTQVGMVIKFAEVEGIIDSMLDVIGAQRNWNARNRRLHRRAIDKRLYGSEEDNSHFKYAEQMFVMLLNYNKHRQLLFQEKTQTMRDALDNLTKQREPQNA